MKTTMRMKTAPMNLVRWFVAELLGTFFLAATVGVAVVAHFGLLSGYTSLFIPFAIGTVVMVMVYLLGPVSGAHLNPAVSLGLFTFRKIGLPQFVSDLIAQFLGAWFGLKVAAELIGVASTAPVITDQAVNIGEFVGTLLLVFAVTSVVLGKVKEQMGGIVIGAALMIALTLSMATGGGILNPAVAVMMGASVGVTYLVMPLLGGLVGAALAILLDDTKAQ